MYREPANKDGHQSIRALGSSMFSFWMVTLLLIFSAGCSTKGKIANPPVAALPDQDTRYSFANHISDHGIGNIMFILAFSGGGTRAAALSYGVLEELKDTIYEKNGRQHRLLDEVDRISSVSGGSFTAAYYGLFGDQIFADYKDVFLYKDVEGELTSRIVGLFDTLGRWFSNVSRTEEAIGYYDREIFRGRTFADLQNGGNAYVLINATDLNSHSQFVFSQRQFDFLCSDLSDIKVARAVAASSAVPVLFHPVLVKRHLDCNLTKPDWLAEAEQEAYRTENMRLEELVGSISFYLDEQNPPYATLVDGGVSDNLGLRAIYRNLMLSGGAVELYYSQENPPPINHIVVLVVDASTTAITDIGKSDEIPSAFDVITAFTDIQLHLYNTETNSVIKDELINLVKVISETGSTIEPYFIEVSVGDIEDTDEQLYMNEVPTSFYLEKEQADNVIGAAKKLLRHNEDYRRLLINIGALPENPEGQ